MITKHAHTHTNAPIGVRGDDPMLLRPACLYKTQDTHKQATSDHKQHTNAPIGVRGDDPMLLRPACLPEAANSVGIGTDA